MVLLDEPYTNPLPLEKVGAVWIAGGHASPGGVGSFAAQAGIEKDPASEKYTGRFAGRQ